MQVLCQNCGELYSLGTRHICPKNNVWIKIIALVAILVFSACSTTDPLSGVEIEILTHNKELSTPLLTMTTPQTNICKIVPVSKKEYIFSITCDRKLKIAEVVKTSDGVNFFPVNRSKIKSIKIMGDVWVQYELCVDRYY